MTAVRVEFGGGRCDAESPDFFHISHVPNKIKRKGDKINRGKNFNKLKQKPEENCRYHCFANILFSVSASFGKMSHQLKFEAVVQNLDRVKKILRLVISAFAVPSMSEAVTQWLPLCPRRSAFFLHLFFVQAVFPDVDMEIYPDCVFQCVDLPDFYYE